MAGKYRPKGKVSDFISLDSEAISKLTENELRGIVSKLNDAANKRIKRIVNAGLEEIVPATRGRIDDEGRVQGFSLNRDETKSGLRIAYLKARNFLKPDSTSTKEGLGKYLEKFAELYEKLMGSPFDSPENFDQRYKRKKVLRKAAKRKIRSFWEKYDEWREIYEENNPDAAKGDTNINNVELFEEEVYNEGKVTTSEMSAIAKRKYIEDEERRRTANEEAEDNSLQTPAVDGGGKGRSKRGKSKWEPREKFEKIKIF